MNKNKKNYTDNISESNYYCSNLEEKNIYYKSEKENDKNYDIFKDKYPTKKMTFSKIKYVQK